SAPPAALWGRALGQAEMAQVPHRQRSSGPLSRSLAQPPCCSKFTSRIPSTRTWYLQIVVIRVIFRQTDQSAMEGGGRRLDRRSQEIPGALGRPLVSRLRHLLIDLV